MDIKDILLDTGQRRLPIFKYDSYTGVYKKTEKIVCAVFLLTDEIQHKGSQKDIISDTREYAKVALVSVTNLLTTEVRDEAVWREVVRAFSTLRSLLYVLVAARALRPDLVDVLAREIDGVLQNTNHWDADVTAREQVFSDEAPEYVRGERRRPRVSSVSRATTVPRAVAVRRTDASGTDASRREAILAIIRQKGVVTIKDISESITDCSEKTIQRELMDLIKDNVLIKEGERRWSKYRVL